MTVFAAVRGRKKPRVGEVAFLLFGAAAFAGGLAAVGTICVVCAHPATVGIG